MGVAAPRRGGLASRSRSAERRHPLPSLQRSPEDWLDAVGDAVQGGGYDLVVPGADAELLTLSPERDKLGAPLAAPEHRTLLEATDKLTLSRRAQGVGISVPAIVEADEATVRDWRYPAIVKPRLHERVADGRPRIEAARVDDAADAALAAERIRASGQRPLIQDAIAGRLLAHTVMAGRDSSVVASVTQLAERTWPLRAGVSARARTVPAAPGLADSVAHLLDELQWMGLAQLQFIVGPGDEPYLIDLNARLYGSLALAIAAGVNVPALQADVQLGRRPATRTEACGGVRYQWLEGDLRAAMAEHGGGRAMLECLRFSWTASGPIWSWRDPLPGLVSIGAAFLRLLRLLRRRPPRPAP